MRHLLLCASVLAGLTGARSAHSADATSPRRTIGRVGAGVQLGGFYDLSDPALELRAWTGRLGVSFNLGQHRPEPSYPGFHEVSSDPGKQVTAGVLLGFNNPRPGRAVPVKLYTTAGLVHATQARAKWEGGPAADGTIGEAGVEGQTGTAPFVGLGAEVGFARLPGLAVGTEFLVAFGNGGFGPGIRFGLRYYPW